MRHLIQATLSDAEVYSHCGLRLDRHNLSRFVRVCLACIRRKVSYEQGIQDGYMELATRRSTAISPFTRD